jgi:hypothetical protein
MCDYSLHLLTSRPAKVGDKLVTTKFVNSITRGFATVEEPTVAGRRWLGFGRSISTIRTHITTHLSSPTGRSCCSTGYARANT